MNENNKIEPRLLQGFRDFLPARKMQRDWLIDIVKEVYESFGFQPLETPVLEYADVLLGKYGAEANQLMYRFKDQGDRDVALRYDLTVPFSRVIAQYPELPKPFKRYQVAPVWRGDSPQAGRYREFYQFDADVAGSSSMVTDAEIVCLIYTVMTKLGIKNFVVRLNNRKILNALTQYANIDNDNIGDVLTIIDKLEKIGPENVFCELTKKDGLNLPKENAEKISSFLKIKGSNDEILTQLKKLLGSIEVGTQGINELEEVLFFMETMEVDRVKMIIDTSIARGLTYYTGTVFETQLTDLMEFGSVFSGGRYDTLIGYFTGQDIPAVGASVGVDRLFTAMEKLNLLPESKSTSQVLVTVFPENTQDSLRAAKTIRASGIKAEVYLGDKTKLDAQLKYANKLGIPYVVITFPDKVEKDMYIVRKMSDGSQNEISLTNLASELKNLP